MKWYDNAIRLTCEQAGCPEAADRFIRQGMPVIDVVERVFRPKAWKAMLRAQRVLAREAAAGRQMAAAGPQTAQAAAGWDKIITEIKGHLPRAKTPRTPKRTLTVDPRRSRPSTRGFPIY